MNTKRRYRVDLDQLPNLLHGLEHRTPAEPTPHARRLLDTLGITVVIDPRMHQPEKPTHTTPPTDPGYRETQTCRACGCPWSDRTAGCATCTRRHRWRRHVERRQAQDASEPRGIPSALAPDPPQIRRRET